MSLPNLLTASDVKAYLKCNDTTLYALLKRRDFPSFRVGKKYYINEDEFKDWMNKSSKVKK